jgi:hypothetical protein
MQVDHGAFLDAQKRRHPKWMRMHEVHRIKASESMAGCWLPGEVIGDGASPHVVS